MAARYPPPTAAEQAALGVVVGAHMIDGGFKSVYAATCTVNNAPVVVTVEPPATAAVEWAVLRRLSSAPPHPNIIQLIATMQGGVTGVIVPDPQGGLACSVLTVAGVQEVFDVVITGGRVHEDPALQIFGQAVAGLRHMHRFGVAHRDVKLENMMLDATGHVLHLIDYNLSEFATINPAPQLPIFDFRQPSTSRGTRSYAAPEALTALAATVDKAATDVCSRASHNAHNSAPCIQVLNVH